MSPSKTLRNGVTVPWIAFGSGTALYGQDAERPVQLAIDSGFKHIDTAQVYVNEDSVGKALARFPRDALFVTTKLSSLKPGESVRTSLQTSLDRLGVGYVDLWLVHTPSDHVGTLKDVWKGCEEVYKEGLAKSIGVSNFTVKNLEEILQIAAVVPQVHQMELHPYLYKASKPLLELHNKHGIVTASYGGLAPIARGPRALDAALEVIRASLEKRHGGPVSAGQVLMKWLQAKDALIVTTTSKKSRMKEYLEAASMPPLTPDEVEALDKEGSKTHYRRWFPHMDQ